MCFYAHFKIFSDESRQDNVAVGEILFCWFYNINSVW